MGHAGLDMLTDAHQLPRTPKQRMVSCWQVGACWQSAARELFRLMPQSTCSSDTFAHHQRSHVFPGKAAHWAYKERPAGAPPPSPAPAGDLAAASTSSSDEGEGLEHLGVEAGHPLLHIKGAAGDAVAMWLACCSCPAKTAGRVGARATRCVPS